MNALEIQNLSKSYPGFTLDHVSFTLPSGCILGLIGENGAGKTTLIKSILGMIRKTSGKIKIFDRECEKNLAQMKEDIGVVLDEVGYPGCMTPKQINHVMRNTYRHWDEEAYFGYLKQLGLPLEKEFKDFSNGMRMKLGISVALSHHAKLLILDEATNGLDPVVRDEIVELFGEFTRDESHSVLFSSHIVGDLEKICDYIAFLHQGKMLLFEEKDRLLEEYGMIHCSREQLAELDPQGIRGVKSSAYSVEAGVRRDKMPSGLPIGPVSMEELFVYMVKGER